MSVQLEEPRHLARQHAVSAKLATTWKCEYGQMGSYSPFDVYLMRDKRIIALVEIRTRRDRTCGQYGTVLIDLDKWFTLMQAEIGLQLPGLYVVAFTDGIWYVRIGSLPVNTYRIEYRGRTDRPQAPNNLSPVIQVPSSVFTRLCDAEGVFED